MGSEASELCLACGLCCNGAMHKCVVVKAEHVPLVSSLGVALTPADDGFTFPQPCALYRESRCSVYPRHPPSCRTYECALLRNLDSGNIPLEECLQIVRDTQALLPPDGAPGLRLSAEAGWHTGGGVRGEGATRAANVETAFRAIALERSLTRHFRVPKK